MGSHRGKLAVSEDIFGCHYSGRRAIGICWAEARGVVKHLTVHQTVPATEDYVAPKVSCAEVEKPYSRENRGHGPQPRARNGPLAKSPVVSTAFCSSFSIAGHLAPIWKLPGACLPPVRKKQVLYGLQNPSARVSHSCARVQASASAAAGPGAGRFGVKAKAGRGALASLRFKEKFFPEEVKTARNLFVNPFHRNSISNPEQESLQVLTVGPLLKNTVQGLDVPGAALGVPPGDKTWEGGVGHQDVARCWQTRHGVRLVHGARAFLERGSVWLRVTVRSLAFRESGGHLKPMIFLLSTTGLDEEELGLPSQAGTASPIEDVHNPLDGHRTSICAINSPWELEVAGLTAMGKDDHHAAVQSAVVPPCQLHQSLDHLLGREVTLHLHHEVQQVEPPLQPLTVHTGAGAGPEPRLAAEVHVVDNEAAATGVRAQDIGQIGISLGSVLSTDITESSRTNVHWPGHLWSENLRSELGRPELLRPQHHWNEFSWGWHQWILLTHSQRLWFEALWPQHHRLKIQGSDGLQMLPCRLTTGSQ